MAVGVGEGILAHAAHQRMVDDADTDLHLLGFTAKLGESRPGEGTFGAMSDLGVGWSGVRGILRAMG